MTLHRTGLTILLCVIYLFKTVHIVNYNLHVLKRDVVTSGTTSVIGIRISELVACSRSKRSLSQRLCEMETNMLAIIAKYQEELAMAHEHRIADEYAQVYAEKEARGRVIDYLHQEATMWMDRFALTLNGCHELPRLLAKAKAMADTYSALEEIHGLLGYCQHMIDLMAHIIRNR